MLRKKASLWCGFYLNNINSTPVEKEVEILESYEKELPEDLIIFAMQKAVENKARNLGYIKAILNSWKNKGITTLSEAKEKDLKNSNSDFKYYDSSGQYADKSNYYSEL